MRTIRANRLIEDMSVELKRSDRSVSWLVKKSLGTLRGENAMFASISLNMMLKALQSMLRKI